MYKLIICIVPHESGELITNAAKQAGAGGGTILMGRGTASNSVLQLLGLGDTSKDITMNIVEQKIADEVCARIEEACSSKKAHFGVLFTIDVDGFMKAGNVTKTPNLEQEQALTGEEKMEKYEMINIIVNKGYAEDAMAAARKAGAGGGTIIGARGTAREGDSTFFGVDIVPEKEMLMILVPQEKRQAIVEAVSALSCFEKAGSGIIFSNEAKGFKLLGKSTL
ncbi:MAG: transcriptional regulator [Treponema sp.]|nr:transcriptional regulator [Treponema sp.]